MNYKNKKILEIAQRHGYSTAKDFAKFIKKYKAILKIHYHRRELI